MSAMRRVLARVRRCYGALVVLHRVHLEQDHSAPRSSDHEHHRFTTRSARSVGVLWDDGFLDTLPVGSSGKMVRVQCDLFVTITQLRLQWSYGLHGKARAIRLYASCRRLTPFDTV